MKLSILMGGKAGQGINVISEILASLLIKQGYYIFNYRDYPSLIRGGHNFNILTVSDSPVSSSESKIDILAALDENTLKKHTAKITLSYENFKDLGRNLNIALAGSLAKLLGISEASLKAEIKNKFDNESALEAAEKGYGSEKTKFNLKKLNKKISIFTGSEAVSIGALNSKLDLYISYPMTPATGVMNHLASNQEKNKLIVFQPESEIAAVNAALGASFTGAKVMAGTSGGGFDLMSEGLSLQGMTEIPLVIYLASRPGPATGVPTYTAQSDLNLALNAGHGEFPRVVIAPGDTIEAIEKTNQAFYLAEKYKTLAIILSDKHLAESEFSSDEKPSKPFNIKINRALPGKEFIKSSSYEHDSKGNTIEDAENTKLNADARLKKQELIKKEIENLIPFKIHGNKTSKNLIVAWGSTKGAVLDAIEGLDCGFLQVLYLRPFSDKIKTELEKAENLILVENSSTGQLASLIKEQTGIKIKTKILKYDARPFYSDELKKQIQKILK